ncbi:MAG: hypothetical protein IJO73_00160 [Clostridia bacterium]|nr:hypothetical protein [Clostridia bacterium]
MNKFFLPRGTVEHISPLKADGDTALILMLILIILREKGDTVLILALIYILS